MQATLKKEASWKRLKGIIFIYIPKEKQWQKKKIPVNNIPSHQIKLSYNQATSVIFLYIVPELLGKSFPALNKKKERVTYVFHGNKPFLRTMFQLLIW